MRKATLILSSLLIAVACSSFSYKWWGADVSSLSPSQLEEIELVAGNRGGRDESGRMCFHLPDQLPRCIMMRDVDFKDLMLEYAEMKERLKNCEEP